MLGGWGGRVVVVKRGEGKGSVHEYLDHFLFLMCYVEGWLSGGKMSFDVTLLETPELALVR